MTSLPAFLATVLQVSVDTLRRRIVEFEALELKHTVLAVARALAGTLVASALLTAVGTKNAPGTARIF